MARDDNWAEAMRVVFLPVLDGARPAGMLGWMSSVAPVMTQSVVGAGHWATGRRRRALAAWASAAGYALVAWGLGTEAPTRAEVGQNMRQTIERLDRDGLLRGPGPKDRAARTQAPEAGRPSRFDPLFKRASTVVEHPLCKAAVTVVAIVLGVWWGLRWPRRLTVPTIALVALNAVIQVPWVARATQRRRPRIAAGYVLVIAGSVARLRAAATEPLR